MSLRQGLDRLKNFDANSETVRRRLAMEENALGKFGDALARVRELTVQAGSGIQTSETHAAIAAEMRELLANMVDIANSQDGEGRYLFSGNAVGNPPIQIVNGVATYQGDDGMRSQRIGDSRLVREGDPGSEVFFGIRNGNGTFFVQPGSGNTGTGYFRNATLSNPAAWIRDNYTVTFTSATTYEVTDSASNSIATGNWSPGETITFNGASIAFEGEPATGDTFSVGPSYNRSVFAMVDQIISVLASDTRTPSGRAQFQNALNATLLDFDRAETHLGNVRSQVGARLAAVEEQRSNNAEMMLQLQNTLSSVRDVDFPKAVSQLQVNLTALEAAQKVFAQTRSLSLFDLL